MQCLMLHAGVLLISVIDCYTLYKNVYVIYIEYFTTSITMISIMHYKFMYFFHFIYSY